MKDDNAVETVKMIGKWWNDYEISSYKQIALPVTL